MRLVVSRSYPAINTDTLTEYSAREALFRANDGSFLLYMTSEGRLDCKERVLALDCRDALIWLNEPIYVPGSFWHSVQSDECSIAPAKQEMSRSLLNYVGPTLPD
jgi:hypothetical protein